MFFTRACCPNRFVLSKCYKISQFVPLPFMLVKMQQPSLQCSSTGTVNDTMKQNTSKHTSYRDAVNTQKDPNLKPPHATILQQAKFPTRDQAVILPSINDTKIEDYLYAIGEIVKPENIFAASRISNGRICIFLSSVQIANELVEKHSQITINQQKLKVRKFITPSKRIILSGVSPHIPHTIVEKALISNNLKLSSPINFIKYNTTKKEYNHVCSFRCQVYCVVDPDKEFNLPDSILIKYEEETVRIFLTDDSIFCNFCKIRGDHITEKCTKNINQEGDNSFEDNMENQSTINSDNGSFDSVVEIENAPEDPIPSSLPVQNTSTNPSSPTPVIQKMPPHSASIVPLPLSLLV